jgi:transcriptional regulator with PAS, ATPase and Fis domain
MTEAGCLRFLQWARREAPDVLKALMISFLTGDVSQSNVKSPERERRSGLSSDVDVSECRGTTTLRQLEREHIAQVISESKTLSEAASKLGIDYTTLYRKRKLYELG